MIKPIDTSKEHFRMVTVRDAARRLKVSRQRVQQFIAEGRLPAVKVTSRMCLVDIRDVDQLASVPRKPGRKSKKSS